MSLKAVLFDLDGTLLPMDQKVFTEGYFKLLAKKLMPYGYEPNALIDGIWKGTYAMMKNDGTKTNEEVFWAAFEKIFGTKVNEDKKHFEDFYKGEFRQGKAFCGFDEKAALIVSELKKMNLKLAVATNPVFPIYANVERLSWANIDANDFSYITSFENSSYCKPRSEYYQKVLDEIGVLPQEALMIGNDVIEDMAAKELGMNVFLLTNCLINKDDSDISGYPNGDFDACISYIKGLMG